MPRTHKYDNDRSPECLAFLADYLALCKKHGLALGHEDGHGSFLVERGENADPEWAAGASEVLWHD